MQNDEPHDFRTDERPSGVPEPHHLGEAKTELRWLLLGLAIVVAIIVAFIFSAQP